METTCEIPGLGVFRPSALGGSIESLAGIALPIFGGAQVPVSLDVGLQGRPSDAVMAAIAAFLTLAPDVRSSMTGAVWDDYLAMLSAYEPEDLPCIIWPDDQERVWDHVRPVHVDVGSGAEDGSADVSVYCDTTWDPEHGIVLRLTGGTRFVNDRWARSGEDA